MSRYLATALNLGLFCTVSLSAAHAAPEGGAADPQLTEEVRRPNIVYVLADQLRYQSCGYAGDAKARTPNIDRLAARGISFRNAVSGHPVCSPYRASLFTGKYTTSTGMVINELRINPAAHECLGQVLTRNGYDTAYIGKWHLYANELGNHEDPKNSFVPPGPNRLGFDGFWAAYNFHHEYYKGYYHTDSPAKIPVRGYEPDVQTDLAIEQIGRLGKGGKPFALFLSVGTPHDPWVTQNVPPEYLAMFADQDGRPRFAPPPNYLPQNDPYSDDWGRFKDEATRRRLPEMMRIYYAMTANLDWNVGRLMTAIQDSGLGDDTIVMFTSDHGEMFGAHGRRAKNIFYEEAVRIPFLIRWPSRVPPGAIADTCLNTPDIMPTLLGLTGLPVPAKVEGMDLSRRALGRDGPQPKAAFMQNTGACAAWEDGYEWRALRDTRYTYAIYRKDRSERLFDNQADPYQMSNLVKSPEHAAVLAGFRESLKQRMTELGDGFEACTWYRDHWTKDRIITFAR